MAIASNRDHHYHVVVTGGGKYVPERFEALEDAAVGFERAVGRHALRGYTVVESANTLHMERVMSAQMKFTRTYGLRYRPAPRPTPAQRFEIAILRCSGACPSPD